MIQSFRDRGTRDVFDATNSKAAAKTAPQGLWAGARRRLDQLNQAHILDDLRVPPGNRLEALKGDRKGQQCIRVNDQYRICFQWTEAGPAKVKIVDYHG
jgi:proteic killer suppression protein